MLSHKEVEEFYRKESPQRINGYRPALTDFSVLTPLRVLWSVSEHSHDDQTSPPDSAVPSIDHGLVNGRIHAFPPRHATPLPPPLPLSAHTPASSRLINQRLPIHSIRHRRTLRTPGPTLPVVHQRFPDSRINRDRQCPLDTHSLPKGRSPVPGVPKMWRLLLNRIRTRLTVQSGSQSCRRLGASSRQARLSGVLGGRRSACMILRAWPAQWTRSAGQLRRSHP
jgi:hypothetical protein